MKSKMRVPRSHVLIYCAFSAFATHLDGVNASGNQLSNETPGDRCAHGGKEGDVVSGNVETELSGAQLGVERESREVAIIARHHLTQYQS